jgi:hypothetical protein
VSVLPIPRPLRPDDTLVFLHIPKTAGTTLMPILAERFEWETIYPVPATSPVHTQKGRDPFPSVYFPGGRVESHRHFMTQDISPYRLVIGHWNFSIVDHIPRPVPMTFFRDPVHRMLSHYRFLRRYAGEEWNHDRERIRQLSFMEWLEHPTTQQRHHNWHTRQMAGVVWADSPNDLSDGELLARAMRNLQRCAFVGMTEHFDDSLLLLAYSFGWSPIRSYFTRNVAADKTTADTLDAYALKIIVEQFSKLDIQLYEYAKIIYHQRLSQMMADLFEINPAPVQAHLQPDLLTPRTDYVYGETRCKVLFSASTYREIARRIEQRAVTPQLQP